MEASSITTPLRATLAPGRIDPGAIGAWVAGLALVLYLGLSNGGYDIVERSQVGIAVWWIVLVGTVVGALRAGGETRAGRALLWLLAGFAAWTALSLSWSESSERTAIELGRVATYLGIFALALAVQGKGRWRALLDGVTVGLLALVALAVLSRLEPGWFPDRESGALLPGIEIERRLAYPLNYSTGLGALAAIALPLLLAATGSARTVAVQALAAGGLPVAALALWLTSSSLAVPVALVGLATFLALAPDRLPKLAALLNAGVGSAILAVAIGQREALDRGLPTPAAEREGDEMIAVLLVVCAGVALVQAGISLATRYGSRRAMPRLGRRGAVAIAAGAVAIVIAGAVVAGSSGELDREWESFTGSGEGTSAQTSRGAQLLETSSSGRSAMWEEAVDAAESEPLTGIGPGTFEFWWGRNGVAFVRDAHSLFLESLAELGLVGMLLIGGFCLAVIAIGVSRSIRAPADLRLGLAAATAACAAFVFAAAMDWMWELGVLPAAFLLLAAVAAGGGAEAPSRRRRGPWGPFDRRPDLTRVGIVIVAVASLVAIAIPLAASSAVQDSREDAADGRLDDALATARTAVGIQPYAATPRLQEALVYERLGDLGRAVVAAREATERESTNWRTWLILSRLEARTGDAEAAARAFRKADSLTGSRVIGIEPAPSPSAQPADAPAVSPPSQPAPATAPDGADAGTSALRQAVVLARRGELDGALAIVQEVTREDPEDPRAWLLLARLEAQAGDREAAAAALARARALAGDSLPGR